jgi:hypothetical protein
MSAISLVMLSLHNIGRKVKGHLLEYKFSLLRKFRQVC